MTPGRVCALPSPLVVVIMLAGGCGGHQLPDAVNYHMEAIVAAEEEDYETAIELITRAIQQNESPDALFDRARFYLAVGRDQEALADCRSGLKLEPDHPDLVWLRSEIEKPVDRRFQGPNVHPPSYHR